MARIRSIHPGIWTDDAFVSMQMPARLLFIGILNECDDQGVFIWKPTQLKMRLLPADNVDVSALLVELTKAGFIRRYAVNGATYGAVRHFREFQRPKKPNAVHPITNEMRSFSGTKAEHNSPPVGNPGGNGGEAVPGEFPQERSTGGGGEGGEVKNKNKTKSPPRTPPPGGARTRVGKNGGKKKEREPKCGFVGSVQGIIAERQDDGTKIITLPVKRVAGDR